MVTKNSLAKSHKFLFALYSAKSAKDKKLIIQGAKSIHLLTLFSLIKDVVRLKIPLTDPFKDKKKLQESQNLLQDFVTRGPALRKSTV
jgi:hypothetical protein